MHTHIQCNSIHKQHHLELLTHTHKYIYKHWHAVSGLMRKYARYLLQITHLVDSVYKLFSVNAASCDPQQIQGRLKP